MNKPPGVIERVRHADRTETRRKARITSDNCDYTDRHAIGLPANNPSPIVIHAARTKTTRDPRSGIGAAESFQTPDS